MSGEREAVDFKHVIDRMSQEQLSAEEWPAVVGGFRAETDLLDWLAGLDLSGMATRIWWFTDHVTIGADGPPGTVEHLERARLFGTSGDLDVRRDGDCFRWRYVGEGDLAPEGDTLQYPGTLENPVYRREREALLWGTRENEQGQWFEDRVAGAGLTYFADPPALPENVEDRVKVKYREYTRAGRTLAVWLLRLERYEEEKNG
jgi:hypothetical protein